MKHENIIGFQDSEEDGVLFYKTRHRLPLKELLKRIDKQMDMLALSFTVIVQNIEDIRSTIAGGKRITFLILNPDSEYVDVHSKLYSDAKNLKYQIEASLDALWNLKNDYSDKVVIKTYNDLAPLAVTIIDNNIIKVEDRLVGRDSNSRPSHLGYKSSNVTFFDRYRHEYDRVLAKATDYHPS